MLHFYNPEAYPTIYCAAKFKTMNKTISLFVFLWLLVSVSLKAQDYKHPFQDPNLTIDQRVKNLVSLMTLEEKVGQLMYTAPAIDRLGVPAYNWWNECLHGVARNGKATVFPQAIGLGATFDTDLIKRISTAISDEARAKFNMNVERGKRDRYLGLTFWSPNVNLFRDPRWGRGQETYGEDPFHISKIGVAFVQGLQGDHPKYLKAAGMAKHFVVHSGPEALRHEFDATVNGTDLWNTYLPAFEALVTEADVEGIMGAYNRTNGDPMCAHPFLMQEVLRKKWGFNGYYVSDCWAIVDFHNGHKITSSPAHSAALALNNGCNLNCGNTYPNLLESVEQGLTTEVEIDKNLKELLPTRFRLGLFEPKGMVPFDEIGNEVVRSPEHLKLAREAAVKSMVLLKNKDNTLPLKKDLHSVFVTGPVATDAQALMANYYGISDNLRTLMEGISAKVSNHTTIRYVQGSLLDRPNVNPIDWFSSEAEEAGVTIACMGITQQLEGEEGESIASPTGGDRDYVGLPAHQIDYLKLMREKAGDGKLVVVITGGSAISVPEVYELADALIYAWYPGEQGGDALGDILFGDENPSGRLPVTVVEKIEDLPPFEDYNMKNRTYRYMEKDPLFPFGFGLSYSDYAYSNIKLSKKKFKKKPLTVSVDVKNMGTMDGEEVVQLYIQFENEKANGPKFTMKGFQRVQLKAGASKTISFEVGKEQLYRYDEKGNRYIPKGNFKVMIGGALPIERSKELGGSEWLEATVKN